MKWEGFSPFRAAEKADRICLRHGCFRDSLASGSESRRCSSSSIEADPLSRRRQPRLRKPGRRRSCSGSHHAVRRPPQRCTAKQRPKPQHPLVDVASVVHDSPRPREYAMAAKFEISKGHAGKFRFHLKAPNGEIIAASQDTNQRPTPRRALRRSRHMHPMRRRRTSLVSQVGRDRWVAKNHSSGCRRAVRLHDGLGISSDRQGGWRVRRSCGPEPSRPRVL